MGSSGPQAHNWGRGDIWGQNWQPAVDSPLLHAGWVSAPGVPVPACHLLTGGLGRTPDTSEPWNEAETCPAGGVSPGWRG